MPRLLFLSAVVMLLLPSEPGFSQNAGTGSTASGANKSANSSRYDKIVDRFIQYDVGQLRGAEGQKAYADFRALNGEEAIPALVRGVNRAAAINNSCPIILISNKLQSLLAQTKNRRLLESASANISRDTAGLPYGSYLNSIRESIDTQLGRSLKKNVLRGGGSISQLRRANKPVKEWSYEDLVEAVGQEKDAALVRVLEQLKDRKGSKYTDALADAIERVAADVKPLARGLLAQRLMRMTDRTLEAKLKNQNAEVRAAAARAVGYKESPLLMEVAALLSDRSPLAATNAKTTLVKLTGEDLGPPENASFSQWFAAKQRWEKFLADNKKTNAP